MQKKLSIIVPVYNVENYIRDCFKSLFRQGLSERDYEIIVVNDGATDHSMEQISDLLVGHDNITVIEQENQGLSVARNNGLAKAKGKYILFIDSDDLLIDGSLPLLLEKALESEADMIICDWLIIRDHETRTDQHLIQNNVKFEENAGRKLFLQIGNLYNPSVCRIFFRRSFLHEHHMRFIPGILFEDIPFTHECYLTNCNCLITNYKYYIYRLRNGSITNTYTMRHAKDLSISIGKTWELRKKLSLNREEYMALQDSMFFWFWTVNTKIIKNNNSFSEQIHTLDYMAKNVPDLKFTNSFHQKFITLLYRISPRLLSLIWIIRSKL